MSKEIDWSKAPEGATHYDPECDAFRNKQGFYLADGSLILIPLMPSNHPRLIERPKQEWTGTGLPPVGTVCECQNDAFKWLPGVIVHTGTDRGKRIAIMQCENEMLWGEAGEFRPIRTPEQIAAEELEKAIQQMIEDADYDGKLVRGLFAKLHDAGYRKVEPK